DQDKLVPVRDPITNNDRVFVDVVAYNSKVYYVEGEVSNPGRLPCTGGDTVLDAIHYAGNLTPAAARRSIRLMRPGPAGGRVQVLQVDYDAISRGTDHSTNYALQPGDRVVVDRDPTAAPEAAGPDLRSIEKRLAAVEGKLDRLIKLMSDARRDDER